MKVNSIMQDENWKSCITLIEKTFVPQIINGHSRPCSEEDYQQYKAKVDRNFQDILFIVQSISDECKQLDSIPNSELSRIMKGHLLILIGEHFESNIWTTTKSTDISKLLAGLLCNLYSCCDVAQLLAQDENDVTRHILITLRPKLLKSTWKAYPADVVCYKWLLKLMDKSTVITYLEELTVISLIILDDFVYSNQTLALECLLYILRHCNMERKFVELGLRELIFTNLQKCIDDQNIKCTSSLYDCIMMILESKEYSGGEDLDLFKWSDRDNILNKFLNNMESEDNVDFRNFYIGILPRLLNSTVCYKWCQRIMGILKDYCEHYGTEKMLEIILENIKTILSLLKLRIPANGQNLLLVFLKLYMNLTRAVDIKRNVIHLLEDCIILILHSSPETAFCIIKDERIQDVITETISTKIKNIQC